MIPGRLLELPARLVGCVFDFVFRPALHLHPDRAPPGYPYERTGRDDPALSRALLKAYGLDLSPEINPRNAIHRAAMLPPDGIAFIARRLGLLDYAPRIRQVVRRADLEVLSPVIDASAWAWLDSLGVDQAWARTPQRPIADPLIADLPSAIDRRGWSVLESAVTSMRPGLAERLLFKLPRVPPTEQHADPAQAKVMVSSVYLSSIGDWDADWEPHWHPLMYGESASA